MTKSSNRPYSHKMFCIKRTCVLVIVALLCIMPVWAQTDNPEPVNLSGTETEQADAETEEDETTQPEDEAELAVDEEDEFEYFIWDTEDITEDIPVPKKKRFENYNFSCNFFSGALYGRGEEILYKYPDKNNYVSELLWDLKPLVYFGLDFDFSPRNPFGRSGFVTSGTVRFGIPLKSGKMEDRDWQFRDSEGLTNYSQHEAFSMNTVMADLSAGYSWRLTDFLSLGACGELSYMYLSWSAENGYYQYLDTDIYGNPIPGDVWTEAIPKKDLYGPVILYNQNWLIFAPLVQAKWKINAYITLEGFFAYSPLIYCAARDDHLLDPRRTSWYYPLLGHYFKGGGKLSFLLFSKAELSLYFSYKHIMGSRGNAYYQKTGAGDSQMYQNGYDAGAGFSAYDLRLALKIPLYSR